MASSRSRKFKLEPITEEELRDTAGMSGFVSFFTNPLLQPNDAEPKQATTGTVPLVATVPTMGTVPKVGSIHPESTPREIRSFSTPGIAPKVETVPSLGTVPGFRARTVQDGHTVWEQQIYEALWREATPSGGPESREIAIGYRHIAKLTRLGLNTVQRNMRTLVDKLALEPVGKYDSDTRTPKTYRVYSYRAILERRAAAGLEWVIKNRQGVTLGTVPKVGPVPTVDTAPKVSRAPVPTVGTGNSPHGGDTFREEEKISREEPSMPTCGNWKHPALRYDHFRQLRGTP